MLLGKRSEGSRIKLRKKAKQGCGLDWRLVSAKGALGHRLYQQIGPNLRQGTSISYPSASQLLGTGTRWPHLVKGNLAEKGAAVSSWWPTWTAHTSLPPQREYKSRKGTKGIHLSTLHARVRGESAAAMEGSSWGSCVLRGNITQFDTSGYEIFDDKSEGAGEIVSHRSRGQRDKVL